MQGYQDFAMGEIFLVLESRIALRNPAIGIWNPGSTFHCQGIRSPVPGFQNPQCGIQDLRLTWGEKKKSVSWMFNVKYVG